MAQRPPHPRDDHARARLPGITGPEVDEACGAREPDVDRWEEGVLYPTWEQAKLLADLCGVTVEFLTWRYNEIDAANTSLRFHAPAADRKQPTSVPFFTAEAIEAATAGAPKELP